MALQHDLELIYRRLGVPQPHGIGFTGLPDLLADIYRHLNRRPPSGASLRYVLEDIYQHLPAAKSSTSAR